MLLRRTGTGSTAPTPRSASTFPAKSKTGTPLRPRAAPWAPIWPHSTPSHTLFSRSSPTSLPRSPPSSGSDCTSAIPPLWNISGSTGMCRCTERGSRMSRSRPALSSAWPTIRGRESGRTTGVVRLSHLSASSLTACQCPSPPKTLPRRVVARIGLNSVSSFGFPLHGSISHWQIISSIAKNCRRITEKCKKGHWKWSKIAKESSRIDKTWNRKKLIQNYSKIIKENVELFLHQFWFFCDQAAAAITFRVGKTRPTRRR